LQLYPGPTEFLLTSPNLAISCQGLDLLAPVVVSATPFIPQLRGDFTQKIKAMSMTTNLVMPTTKAFDSQVTIKVSMTDEAIVATGTLAPK
jgi:hypothetical protein